MIKKILLPIMLLCAYTSYGQSFLNGDFEINSATADMINMPNALYNSTLSNTVSFGTVGNVDLITSANYCSSSAQQGSWYIALTGGGTDAVSLELSAPLIPGEYYTISFYDRWAQPPASSVYPFLIGQSTIDTSFGTLIYTAPDAVACVWTFRTFTFMAPNNGKYITAKLANGTTSDTWCSIDNLTMQLTTDLNSLQQSKNIEIFPNPFAQLTTIKFPTTQTNTNIRIINMLGEEIKSINFSGKELVFDKADIKAGVYFLQTSDEQHQIKNHKIIIQ